MAKIINELNQYQTIPRELIFDNQLSDRARFVYCYMAAKPNEWDFFLEPMAKELGYSVDTLRKYIKELIERGWIEKGQQENENGRFGAVEYTIKATTLHLPTRKNTDTVNFRDGKNPRQYNKDCKENKEYKEEKREEEEKKILKKKEKDILFEECWKAYKRKGHKGIAQKQWDKLPIKTRERIMPHIKAYVSCREMVYQSDFERYLRNGEYDCVVIKGNKVIYDPNKNTTTDYAPDTGGSLNWNDYYNCYVYIGMFIENLADGYSDDTRPDGATIMLSNGRGFIEWNKQAKQWMAKA